MVGGVSIEPLLDENAVVTADRDAQDGTRRIDPSFNPPGRADDGLGKREDSLSKRSQLHVPRASHEEIASELILQPTDLLAQRRLRDRQTARSAPKVKLLGQKDEGFREAQVYHLVSPLLCRSAS